MTTIASLRGQVARLRERIPLPTDPKQWFFELVEDEELPESIQAQFSDHDEVTIRRIMTGYMEPDPNASIGHVTTLKGHTSVIYRDGRKEPVHGKSRR